MEQQRQTPPNGTGEHTLVCLSPSPSSARIVRTAARMAQAFGGGFTALYVQTPAAEKLSAEDAARLQENIRLAQQCGADPVTVHGDDIPYQIAEFARLSGVTRVVLGRSAAERRHFWSRPTLTERLIGLAPALDIHIIPDAAADVKYQAREVTLADRLLPRAGDLAVTAAILCAATAVGLLFLHLGMRESNITAVYLLGVLLTSLFTKGYAGSVVGSFLSVILFNFFFTEPRLTLHAYDPGSTVTFGVMLAVSIVTGTLASKLKDQAKLSAQAAFRTKVLFDTDQLLRKAQSEEEALELTARQLLRLLGRDLIVYPEENGALLAGRLFAAGDEGDAALLRGEEDRKAAEWVRENRRLAGATTERFGEAQGLYFALRIRGGVCGVVGVRIGARPLDSFENSVALSMLGECALAIENSRNTRAKEQAAVLAENERLRANLLRSISHDLRTPLTSISGNADNLLSNYKKLDDEARGQIFTDIYDDAQWLISLVENLLSITRIEEGSMHLNLSVQLMEEVVEEAVRRLGRKSEGRVLEVQYRDELLLARMDPKLILQVLLNLLENAVKYTPAGSKITVTAGRCGETVCVSVADDGEGIPAALREKVFEMFYTGDNKIADNRRSLGLGLPLCRSIIRAHGGEITLSDNVPHGAVFTFTIPSDEVNTHA